MTYQRFVSVISAFALTALFCATGAAPAWADDVNIDASFDCSGIGCAQEVVHTDAEPFKGWANFTLHNLGLWRWFDFHLIIFDSGSGCDDVDWIVSTPFEPFSSQSGLTWEVHNDAVGGATIDFAFTEPVMPDATATFSIYTDNTTWQWPSFGVKFYPTIIPEPNTALLVVFGLVGLGLRRRRAA